MRVLNNYLTDILIINTMLLALVVPLFYGYSMKGNIDINNDLIWTSINYMVLAGIWYVTQTPIYTKYNKWIGIVGASIILVNCIMLSQNFNLLMDKIHSINKEYLVTTLLEATMAGISFLMNSLVVCALLYTKNDIPNGGHFFVGYRNAHN